jgi:hypothetical protein
MNATPKPTELLSLNELSRKLDMSYPHALNLHERGLLPPDFVAKKIFLYRPSRLPELHELIQL